MTEVRTALRAAGMRVTAPRRSVLEWLAGHPHATVGEIRDGVRAVHGPISNQAVYDVLGAGVRAGLVRRLEPAGHPARYERRVDDHDHLVCRRCGRVRDTATLPAAGRPCADPGRGPAEFAVDTVEITFWGRCGACARGDV